MHIGLIGGIGPAATDYYYQRLIAAHAALGVPLELTIVHADSPTLIEHLGRDDQAAQVAIYRRLTERLARAGADCVVVTSIGGHFCIDPFKAVSPLPVIDLLEAVSRDVANRGVSRIGILGTATVMRSRFYGGIGTAEVVPPGAWLDAVHEAYVTMAVAGRVNDDQRRVFASACEYLFDSEKVDAILLGGTDLALVYDEDETDFPVIDGAAVHVRAIVEAAGKEGRTPDA